MPVFAQTGGGTLTEKQVNILAEGLKAGLNRSESASRPRGAPPLTAMAGVRGQASASQLARGERAYATYCARCHGAEGTGGASGGSLLEPAFLGLVSDQGLRTTVIVGREDLGMPGWQGAGERPMTAAEVSDVVAWLGSHRTAPGVSIK
jgi:cytochrome c oxidase cbb3-type subunit 3/ubiquinol-cytochrome c reductase cytochrome c subunit